MTEPNESLPQPPLPYSEEHSGVHPKTELAGLHLEQEDVEVINGVLGKIAQRREELQDQQPKEIFAGMTTGAFCAAERGGMLVVVDVNRPGTDDYEYVVRSARIGVGAEPEIFEDVVSRDRRSDFRGLVQELRTRYLGTLRVGKSGPDQRFDYAEYEMVPYAAIDGERLVSLENIFSPYTERERIGLALSAIDPERQHGRYPNIDSTPIAGNSFGMNRLTAVRSALHPLNQILTQELRAGSRGYENVERTMTAGDRARLVGMAHEIMAIANAYPENVDHGNVIDPVQAAHMAHAENDVRKTQKGNGPFNRRRERNENERNTAATHAAFQYEQELQRRLRPQQ